MLCKNGHDSLRRKNGNCIQCEKERYFKCERKNIYQKEYSQKRRQKIKSDPELLLQHKQYMKEYRLKNRIHLNKMSVERAKKTSVEKRLSKKGLSEEYVKHVKNHIGVCDICGQPPNGKWKQLNIDHCHKTNIFRGMLCSNCNLGIGYFKDNPILMKKAIEYIEKQQSIQ